MRISLGIYLVGNCVEGSGGGGPDKRLHRDSLHADKCKEFHQSSFCDRGTGFCSNLYYLNHEDAFVFYHDDESDPVVDSYRNPRVECDDPEDNEDIELVQPDFAHARSIYDRLMGYTRNSVLPMVNEFPFLSRVDVPSINREVDSI